MNMRSVRLRPVETIRELRSALRPSETSLTQEEVHSLRRLIRRVETILHVLGPDAVDNFPGLLKDLARIGRKAGAVRDMDVLIKLASALPVDQEEECLFKILDCLTSKRKQGARKLHRAIVGYESSTPRDLKDLSDYIEKGSFILDQKIANARGSEPAPVELVTSISGELAAGPRLGPDNLHAFRLRVRELRSVLQLLGHDSNGLVKLLGAVKDAIGEWHDWTVLASTAADIGCAARSEVMKEIRRTVRAKYDSARVTANMMRKNIAG